MMVSRMAMRQESIAVVQIVQLAQHVMTAFRMAMKQESTVVVLVVSLQ